MHCSCQPRSFYLVLRIVKSAGAVNSIAAHDVVCAYVVCCTRASCVLDGDVGGGIWVRFCVCRVFFLLPPPPAPRYNFLSSYFLFFRKRVCRPAQTSVRNVLSSCHKHPPSNLAEPSTSEALTQPYPRQPYARRSSHLVPSNTSTCPWITPRVLTRASPSSNSSIRTMPTRPYITWTGRNCSAGR